MRVRCMIPNCNWGIETDFLGTPEVVAHQQWHEDKWENEKKAKEVVTNIFGNDFGYRNKGTHDNGGTMDMNVNAVATKASYSQKLNEEISNLFSVFSDLEVRINYVLSNEDVTNRPAESTLDVEPSSTFVYEMESLLDRLRGFNTKIRETTERVRL